MEEKTRDQELRELREYLIRAWLEIKELGKMADEFTYRLSSLESCDTVMSAEKKKDFQKSALFVLHLCSTAENFQRKMKVLKEAVFKFREKEDWCEKKKKNLIN